MWSAIFHIGAKYKWKPTTFCLRKYRAMQENSNYYIEVQGAMNENAFNASSPLCVKVARTDTEATLLVVHTDQSGFVGLIKHLHQQGFVLLSMSRK